MADAQGPISSGHATPNNNNNKGGGAHVKRMSRFDIDLHEINITNETVYEDGSSGSRISRINSPKINKRNKNK